MPGGKSPGPSIKRTHQYERLKEILGGQYSGQELKAKAAAFSNAQAKKAHGGKTPPTKKAAAKDLARNKRKRNGK